MKLLLSQQRFLRRTALVIGLAFLWALAGASAAGQALRGLSESLNAAVVVDGTVVGLRPDGAIVRSIDQGASFVELRASSSLDSLRALAASGQVVVAGGSSGLLVRAGNLGESPTAWVEVSAGGILSEVHGLAHNGGGHWVAVGEGTFTGGVLLSSDQAQTWTAATHPPASFLYAVEWNGHTEEWMAVGGDGFDGAIYRSVNGHTWSEVPVPAGTPPLLALAIGGDGQVLAVGESGALVLSTGAGTDFFSLGGEYVSEDLRAVVSVGPEQWLVGGVDGVVVSVSGESGLVVREPDSSASAINSLVSLDGSVFLSGQGWIQPPEISPGSGSYPDAVLVALSATEGAIIFFTMDGREPNTGSTPYEGEFLVGQAGTVKAVAVIDGLSSAVSMAIFSFPNSEIGPLHLEIQPLSSGQKRLVLGLPRLGRLYQLETSVDLLEWQPLEGVRTSNGDALHWDVEAEGAFRFYRVRESGE
jgi:hypothetical protein